MTVKRNRSVGNRTVATFSFQSLIRILCKDARQYVTHKMDADVILCSVYRACVTIREEYLGDFFRNLILFYEAICHFKRRLKSVINYESSQTTRVIRLPSLTTSRPYVPIRLSSRGRTEIRANYLFRQLNAWRFIATVHTR